MSRTAGWVAWSVCAVSLLVMTLGLLLIVLGWSTPLPLGWYPWTLLASDIVGALGAPILGGLIASRRPENPYGWLWLGVSISLALAMFAQVYTAYPLVVAQGSLPAPRTVAVMVPLVGWVVALVLAPFLFLLFPTGRLPSWRWRSLAWSVVAAGTALVILALFLPGPTEQFVNPISMEGVVGGKVRMLLFGGELLLYGAIVLSALSLVFRYRGAGRQERQQLSSGLPTLLLSLAYTCWCAYPCPTSWTACSAPRS
jgi:hypothetical protein